MGPLEEPVSVRDSVSELITTSSYRPTGNSYIDNTPYHRPLDADRLSRIKWDQPLTEEGLLSDESLVANRLLMNIYESDALFLPSDGLSGKEKQFTEFYGRKARLHSDLVRPAVESYVFDSLGSDVQINGRWDCDALESHVLAAIDEAVNGDRPALRAIEEAADPRRAAEIMIAQMALDGLTEATAMSQNLGGAYGLEQSEVFKIFIDEFGYGVFDAKHSTLFVELCRSVGMNTEPHHYWFYYLPSWIAGNNYFYKVTKNRAQFFRYIGGMAFLEATFAPSFAAMTKTFRAVYGDQIDTRYFDEHAHIDQHHGRMAVNDLLLPLARKHGDYAIRELLRGIEDVRALGRLNDADLIGQLGWQPEVTTAETGRDGQDEPREIDARTPFETMISDHDMTVSVLDGTAELHWSATGGPLEVATGQAVRVPKGRLYGLRAGASATIAFTRSSPRADS
ncbi:hypothetical protein GCM10022252_07830 [Streptosporangium oxazolinicum]|uniref:Iron-containing redox enzyme family protein n=1 Tax=Streptosporangium oxazolinicum TaxID=909287 RepID=A0ABP8ADN4_9ACTN